MLTNKKISLNELSYGDVCKRSRALPWYPDIQDFEAELLAAIDNEFSETNCDEFSEIICE